MSHISISSVERSAARVLAFAIDKVKLLLTVGLVLVSLLLLALLAGFGFGFYSYLTANPELARKAVIAEANNYSSQQSRLGASALEYPMIYDKDGNARTYEENYGSPAPSPHFRLTNPTLVSVHRDGKVYGFTFAENSTGKKYCAMVRFYPFTSEVIVVAPHGGTVWSSDLSTLSRKDELELTGFCKHQSAESKEAPA